MKKQELINKLINSSTRVGITDIEKSEYFPQISSILDQITTLEYEKISVEISDTMVLNINFTLNPYYPPNLHQHTLNSYPIYSNSINKKTYTIMISYPLISSHVVDMKEGECVYTIAMDKEVVYSDCMMFSEVMEDLYNSTHQIAMRDKQRNGFTPQQMLEYLDKNKPSQEAINEYNKHFGKSVEERREITPEEVFNSESTGIIKEYIKQCDYNRSLKQRMKTWMMKMKYKLTDFPLKITKIILDKDNRMLRIGFGKNNSLWFFRIDLWFVGFRIKRD